MADVEVPEHRDSRNVRRATAKPDAGCREPSRPSTRRPRTVAGYSPKVEPRPRAVSASSLNQRRWSGVLSSPAAWATSGGSANEIWGSSDTGPLPGSHGTRAFPDSGCQPPRLWPRNRPCLTCESSSPVGPPSRSKRSLCSDPDSPASSTRYRVIDDPRANLDASVDRTRLFRAGPDHARRELACCGDLGQRALLK